MSTATTEVASARRTSMTCRSRDVDESRSASPRRGHLADRSVDRGHATSVCRRRPLDAPEYVSYRDESCRLLQRISPRRGIDPRGGSTAGGGDPTINTYYQELIQNKLDQQRTDYEQQQMNIINDSEPTVFRCGSKGAPWRQLKLTTGARGENIMFIDGDVKCKDMLKFYPAPAENVGPISVSDTPPRPLPHFYVGDLSLDPNNTARWLKERNKVNKRSGEKKSKQTTRKET